MSNFEVRTFNKYDTEESEKPIDIQVVESFIENIEREKKDQIKLGSGRTAHVWFTESPRFSGTLCVKELHTSGPSVNSFERETELQDFAYRSGASVQQPYWHIKSGEAEYIIMSIMNGETIDDMEKSKKTLSDEELSKFRASLEEEIRILHKARIHHRDLHEGNVIVREDGTAGIIDFGDAKRSIAIGTDEIYTDKVVENGRFVRYG